MARTSRFPPAVRERAVRMVFGHAQEHATQWAAITAIAEEIGCAAETLRSWVRQAERDGGRRSGLTTDERAQFERLERETHPATTRETPTLPRRTQCPAGLTS